MKLVATLLLASAAMPLLAQVSGGSAGAPSANASAEWGVLGEMAGRDFEGKNFFINVRWAEPDRRLTVDFWQGDWSGNFRSRWEFVRSTSGKIQFLEERRAGKGSDACEAVIGGAGSVDIVCPKYRTNRWLAREDDGKFRWGNKTLIPMDPTGKHAKRMAMLSAEGRITPSEVTDKSAHAQRGAAAAYVGPVPAARRPASAAQLGIPDAFTLAGRPGYLGVETIEDPQGSGLKLIAIDPVGPLGSLGLKPNDLLLRVATLKVKEDGTTLYWDWVEFKSTDALRGWLDKHGRGTEAHITYMKLDASGSGRSEQVKVRLEQQPEPLLAAAPLAGAGLPTSLPPMVPTLAAALQQEPQHASLDDTLGYAEQWGVLAKLASRLYRSSAVADSDGAFSDVCYTFMKNVGCYVLIAWHEPGRSLARSWYSDTGNLIAFDTFTLGDSPSLFNVERRYYGTQKSAQFEVLATANELIEGGLRYSLIENDQMPFYDDLRLQLTTTNHYIGFSATPRRTAVSDAVGVVSHIAEMKKNMERERRQAQRSESMATIYGGLQAMGQVLAEGQRQSQASLNATIANAQSQGSQEAVKRAQAQQRAVEAARQRTRPEADIASSSPVGTRAAAAAHTGHPIPTSSMVSSPSTPRMCTTPGGSREWSTGMLTPLADARAEYEKEASWARSKGNSISPLQCGKTVTAFGVASAVCRATITWPEKSSKCGPTVSPQ